MGLDRHSSWAYYWPVADVPFSTTEENTGLNLHFGEGASAMFHFYADDFHDYGATKTEEVVCQANLDEISWTVEI